MEKLVIIGAGSWGSGLARIIGDNGYEIMMYDINQKQVDEINQFHTNRAKLPVGVLNESVRATSNLKEAIAFGAIVVLVVPTAVIRSILYEINAVIRTPKLFVNASKGLEPNTFKRVSEIVEEEISPAFVKGFVALSGPSHAEEVILQMLTLVTAASKQSEYAELIQRIFSNQSYFRVYTTNDLVGVELCGALKNVIALASGIVTGLGYGDNTKAALITRGLVEIKRLALVLGANEATVYGLAGLGDLVVTCMSNHSRNYQAGLKIGSGKNLEQTLSEMTMVVEGARTAIAAHQIIQRYEIYAPIMETVYDIIYLKHDPREAILELMKSSLKPE
ncbi:MAG TPA: NAD(P)H-dependent glycerol-3-phosphate dehydrogenase [Bacilli bacterium]|nr:MAG: Glycerol-3-phosphate dehydrogenase (NAD(P)+) [Tenericutes bacterium ADurb.BinA124]HNZ50652.1 NAD(P)H-dependent glycerol-3-phosphate dehydrogenase [Bacilli bacterium]HPX84679.1 NAD(P)H-dependent glycerol-3-phosphate dehydrogenase [Bacilli bacterium]HQC74717.1 NAD(P)H-dependent glycerol-3-phosphate dehydrogenase [Bacilli bacterium]